ELVAPDPCQEVPIAKLALPPGCKELEETVSSWVPEAIVVCLEVVDIQHGHARRHLRPTRLRQLGGQRRLPNPAVRYARERIGPDQSTSRGPRPHLLEQALRADAQGPGQGDEH